MPDLDILPGLVLGDPRAFHHQGTHSIVAAAGFGILISLLSGMWSSARLKWGIWAAGIYASHVLLDLLGDDLIPPFGVQLLWPFSEEYFISPVTIFRSVYFGHSIPLTQTLSSVKNLFAALQEILLISPFVALSWYFAKHYVAPPVHK